MSKPRWVYVAGPYTSGDVVVNVRHAVEAGLAIRAHGLVPVVPHLFHLAHTISPRSYAFWLDWDFELLEKCDAIVRLPGDSAGADREVDHARVLGLHVVVIPDAWRGAPDAIAAAVAAEVAP